MASRRDAVAPTVDRILEAVAPAGLDEDRLTDLAVALAEASQRGRPRPSPRPKRRVAIVLVVGPDAWWSRSPDSGIGFDARRVHDPTSRSASCAGRTRDLPDATPVDEVSYNASGNTVRSP